MKPNENIWRVEWVYCIVDGMRYERQRDYKTERGANKKKTFCENMGFKTKMFEISLDDKKWSGETRV